MQQEPGLHDMERALYKEQEAKVIKMEDEEWEIIGGLAYCAAIVATAFGFVWLIMRK